MFKKRLTAVVVAALLALFLSVVSPLPTATPIVLADTCSSTASGCN